MCIRDRFIDVAVTGLSCLEESYYSQITNEEGFRQIAVKGNSKKGCRVDIVCQSLKYRDHNYRLLEETYLVVDIYGDEGCRDLEEIDVYKRQAISQRGQLGGTSARD